MIEFTLFGTPVRILPWHWVGLLFISGAYMMDSTAELPFILLFMVAALFSVLSHELAHAVVGRYMAGGAAVVTLEMFGGVTEYYGSRFTRKGRIFSVAAGPGINVATLVLCLAVCFAMVGGNMQAFALLIKGFLISPWNAIQFSSMGFVVTQDTIMPMYFLASIMWTSFWWSLLNLLPIYPMDGGLLLEQFLKSRKNVFRTGLILSVVMVLVGITFKSFLMILFMAQFAYLNYQSLKQERF